MIVLDKICGPRHRTGRPWVANPHGSRGCGGAEMGEQATRDGGRLDPSWPTVAATTVRLWLERRSHGDKRSRRQRGVLLLSALAAMALGALVTLAFTHTGQAKPPSTAANGAAANAAPHTNPLQTAAANRSQTAAWIAQQVLPGTVIGCDPEMCAALEAAKVPAGSLYVLQPTTPDPLNSVVVVATPAVRNQFGSRLASVYAPQLIASFGTGAEQIDIRYVVPGGAAAFEASLAPDRSARITAGKQLLNNKNVQASAGTRAALLAGNVDPRLLITLSALAHKMPVQLLVFDDSSPGASSTVPLRGAEIGTTTSAGLSAMLAFLAAQRTPYLSSVHQLGKSASGKSIVIVQFDAPGPLGLGGS
jgi:hypothetical protein